MRFVLAAYRKTRRRVQLENLLLLLLRMLAVAALAFAVARPFASGDSPLIGLQEERRDLVLVIDGSASTGYRAEVESVFGRIKERAGLLLEGLDEGRGDRARLILAGDRPRVFPWTDPADARSILQSIERPLDESLDLALALGEVAAVLEESAQRGAGGGAEVRLLSDLQESTFLAISSSPSAAEGEARPALAEQLSRIEALGLAVLVEDLGRGELTPPNLSVDSILVLGEGPRAGTPFEVAVGVTNHGERELLAERVALKVGGERLPSQRIDIPARGKAEAVFTVTLEDPGYLDIVATLEGDRLSVDDSRARVVLAPPPLEVLVVNGAPADRVEEDEAGYLLAVLEPPTDELGVDGASSSPFRVRTISPSELDAADSPIEEADLIVLANVPPLSSAAVTRLEERVAAGAGLLITAGDRLGDLSGWSQDLFRTDGTGLLPGEPVRRVSAADRTRYYRVNEFDEEHPALNFFGDERWRPLLTEAPFYDFVSFTPSPTARVLAAFDDTARSPFLLERGYGDGKVVLWTSSLDRAWNRVPDSPGTFVPLVLELVQDLGARFQQERNLAVGSGIELVVDSFPRAATLISPSGAQRPIEGDSTERPDRRWALPMLDGSWMDSVGVYTVRTEGGRTQPVAVQLDARESDLARATALEVEAIHPALRVATVNTEGGEVEASIAPRQGELWRWLALAALIFLVAESLWGAWIGTRRRVHS